MNGIADETCFIRFRLETKMTWIIECNITAYTRIYCLRLLFTVTPKSTLLLYTYQNILQECLSLLFIRMTACMIDLVFIYGVYTFVITLLLFQRALTIQFTSECRIICSIFITLHPCMHPMQLLSVLACTSKAVRNYIVYVAQPSVNTSMGPSHGAILSASTGELLPYIVGKICCRQHP
jgi:hypothetical protein